MSIRSVKMPSTPASTSPPCRRSRRWSRRAPACRAGAPRSISAGVAISSRGPAPVTRGICSAGAGVFSTRGQPGCEPVDGDARAGWRPRRPGAEPAAQPVQPADAERADADPVVRVVGRDRVGQQVDRRRRLGVDVEPGLGERRRTARRAVGIGSTPPIRAVGDLGVRQLGDGADAVGDPVQPRVVEGQQHPVGGGVDVGLQVAVAERDRLGEGVPGVLPVQVGRVGGAAAVGEGGERGVEVGVRLGPHDLNVMAAGGTTPLEPPAARTTTHGSARSWPQGGRPPWNPPPRAQQHTGARDHGRRGTPLVTRTTTLGGEAGVEELDAGKLSQ